MTYFFLFASVVLAQPPNIPLKEWSYTEAMKTGKPVVCFVGVAPRDIAGVIVCQEFGLNDGTRNAIVVSRDGKRGYWLSVNATDAEIRRAAGLAVSRAAIPFAVDDSPWLSVGEQAKVLRMWPKTVDWSGFRFYRPTQYSQRIAVTNNSPTNAWYHVTRDDVWSNAPTSFNPNRVDERWRAPGGLANVKGWESFTAAYLPAEPRTWVQALPIANGGMIPGGKRWAFADGTVFADLLTKDGQAFELRLREKDAGKWNSFVAYRNRANAPAGYHGVGRKCAECHDKAGDSEQYGITTRGSDTVFSFLPALQGGPVQ